MSLTHATSSSTDVPVEVFWRPGCPYCARLRRDLRRRGIEATWRNIWDDPAAATVVRAANGGNETVPTVRAGDQLLTNPTGQQVAAALTNAGSGTPSPTAHPGERPLVTATLGSVVVAASTNTVLVEGNHYFPAEDVDPRYLTPTRTKTLCPWKGIASYYTVTTGEASARNAAWTYRHPFPLARRVKGRVAFWGGIQVQVEQPRQQS